MDSLELFIVLLRSFREEDPLKPITRSQVVDLFKLLMRATVSNKKIEKALESIDGQE